MGTNFRSLQAQIPTWMAQKARVILQALPVAALAWADTKGKQLSKSPDALDQAALSMEIRTRFVRAGMSPQDQQTIINGALTAVLLAAVAEMPAGKGQPAKLIQAFPRLPSSRAIDLETKRLEQLAQKRRELFQVLSRIVDSHHASAEGIIQSMRG